jgi:hypothetical protein
MVKIDQILFQQLDLYDTHAINLSTYFLYGELV